MRTMLAALLGIALMAAAAPAFAHVVEVTTAVSLADVDDQEALTAAIHAAVNEGSRGRSPSSRRSSRSPGPTSSANDSTCGC